MFRMLTTCKPSQNKKEFLEFNELVLCCSSNNWLCSLINGDGELPKDFDLGDNFELIEPANARLRPILTDFTVTTDAEWLIISNSDIWIDGDLVQVLAMLDRYGIDFASTRRWDLPEDIKASKDFVQLQYFPIDELMHIGKRQSMRTMDLFVVRKKTLDMAIGHNVEIGQLIPGTVGFDNNFFGFMSEICKTCDLSDVLNVLHSNHESFRKVFRRNYMINRKQQVSFIEKRDQQRVILTTKGCLTWADFRLECHGGGLKITANNFCKLRYYAESARIKVNNSLENFVFNINMRLYEFINKFNIFSPSIRLLFGKIFIIPVLRDKYNYDRYFYDEISELIDLKVQNWKKVLIESADIKKH
jgi:hypothetical protein